MRRPARSALPALLLPLVALLASCGGGAATRTVTLALDFTPNAAHAGVYAALAEHRDRAHGIELVVRQPTATTDSLKLLALGRADVAVADIHDLGLARQRGEDVVGIGALVQRPLAAVIAGAPIHRPRELEGKTVGVTGVASDNAVLRSVVSGDGGSPNRVHELTIGFSAVQSLIAHKVAAVTAFWNDEGVTLRRQGAPIHEFRVDDYGAPRYPELVLVVRRRELREEPAALRATLAALSDGTRAALGRPTAAIRQIAAASSADPGLVGAEFAAIRSSLTPPLVLSRPVLAAWAVWDTRFGILARRPSIAAAFDFTLARRAAG